MLQEPYHGRLTKVVEFLEKLPDHHFKLSALVLVDPRVGFYEGCMSLKAIAEGREMMPQCGTVACVAGWLPAIFPNEFKWEINGRPRDIGGEFSALSRAPSFLGIAEHFFFPAMVFMSVELPRLQYESKKSVLIVLHAV